MNLHKDSLTEKPSNCVWFLLGEEDQRKRRNFYLYCQKD
uniref:Uncharacterized protein n=1 Tax=Amphimedon queenslandica TaxID=400682 RepID=A0A1X7TCE9_AMPQE